MDRRTFLATPLVFGLEDLLAQDPVPGRPEWFDEALRRMKETGRLGVVIVVPELAQAKPDPRYKDLGELNEIILRQAREAPRRRIGTALWILANRPHPEAHAILCEAVFVCMTPELADSSVRIKGDARNRILLAPDGSRVASDAVTTETFEDPAKFAASFGAFLRSEGKARIRERSETLEKSLPDPLRTALARLDDEDAAAREAAVAALAKEVERLVPCLFWHGMSGSAERRGRAKDLLRRPWRSAPEDRPGPKLPYGAVLPRFVLSCSDWVEETEVVVMCGLAAVVGDSPKFLRFLAK